MEKEYLKILDKYTSLVDAHEPDRNTVVGKANRIDFFNSIIKNFYDEIEDLSEILANKGISEDEIKEHISNTISEMTARVAL